jgi:nucleotide-binding universal stress UspA family protein
MYKRIMIPIDLAHAEALERSCAVAGDLASQFGSKLVYVGVTASVPGALGHNPAEFTEKLAAFAKSHASKTGVSADIHTVISHDPAAEMNSALMKAVKETEADLVVMQSHKPGLADYIFEGHGPYIAQHADASVMLVRD